MTRYYWESVRRMGRPSMPDPYDFDDLECIICGVEFEGSHLDVCECPNCGAKECHDLAVKMEEHDES